jgi:peptidoglycan lytic transglycosylase
MLRFRQPLTRVLTYALTIAAGAFVLAAGVASAAPASAADAQSQAASAQAKLNSMRTKLESGISAYSHAEKDLARTRAEVAKDTKHLAAVKASLFERQRSLDSQAVFLYRTDGTGFVNVLLGASTFDDFAARLSVLQTIAGKDAALVTGLKRDRQDAAATLRRIKARELQQTRLVRSVAAQRDSMQSSINEQEAVLNSLSSQAAALLAAEEKAARSRATASTLDPPASSVRHSVRPSSGSSSLKLATVEGRTGQWWTMSSEPSKYRSTGVTFSGGATIYSVADNGTGTSSGKPLNDRQLTCAHRTLPFGTRIAVTHGSKRIIVVVTDRGPYTKGRVIDLTPRGASLLGIDGVGSVKCEVVEGE